MARRHVLLTVTGAAVVTAGLGLSAAPALAAAPVTTTAPTPTSTSRTPAQCDAGPWNRSVQGVPANFQAGDRGGDYLWHDATGFHLRVTHKGDDRVVYTGIITSPTPMRIDPVKLEKGDVARLSADHRSLIFVFADYGHIDGVNFHTDCAPEITVSHLNAGNQPLSRNRVYLGAQEVHPATVPFTVHRSDQS